MGSETHFDDIPDIDFSDADLKPGTDGWSTVKSQVQNALEEFGCFRGTFYKISPELREATFDAIREVFDLPLQTKLLNHSPKPNHGYNGQIPAVPLYESLGFDNADILEEVERSTNVLWPDGNPNFSKTIQAFSKHVSELEQLVERMVLESLGLEKYIDEIRKSAYYLLRVNRYGAPKNAEKNIGLPPHRDSNTITILFQNKIDGLEIQTKDGDWITVKASPDSFIVMVGESLYAWTNERMHSPYHRVMITGNNTRYSLGLFSKFKAGYMVRTPEELVDEEHALLYKPFDYGEYLDSKRQSREDKSNPNLSLKSYCGV